MKKWLILIGILFIIQIPFNFHYNAYYYATHGKNNSHQDYKFVLVLGNIYLPDSYVPGYQVIHQTLRTETLNEVKKTNKDGASFSLEPGSAEYKQKDDKNTQYLIFTHDGRIDKTLAENKKPNREAYKYLNDVENEIRHNSRRPIINLQWLWNIWFKISS